MLLLVSLVLFIALGQTQEVITPLWSCWFPTYKTVSPPAERIINLVFGYNNTASESYSFGTGTQNNRITPERLDGVQPILFKPGLHELDFSLNDYNHTLIDGHPILWTLNGKSVTVLLSDIIDENRCDSKYQGHCPMWIDHFCDDSHFCNGMEICTSPDIAAFTTRVIGRCKNQSTGVVCQPGFACSESSLACIDSTPPPPPPPSIIPSFHCWFYTYDEIAKRMVFNVALNYNNTGSNILIRPVTTSSLDGPTQNEVFPTVYNNLQPTIFYAGFRENAFLLKDTVNLLVTPDGEIKWKLSDRELSVTKELITPENKCGGEGDTQAPTIFVPVVPEAPTTRIPGSDQDGKVHTRQCSAENPDCTMFDSFCEGPYQCDIDVELCVQMNPLFSPCATVETSITSGAPLHVTCVEHLSICVAAVNCTLNSECNDGLLCNGKETCINGTCVAQVNLTIEELCGTVNAICIEGQGCIATNQTVSKELVVTLSASLVAGFILIVFVLGWFFSSRLAMKEEGRRIARRY